jgi:cell division protein FtsW
LTALVSAIRDRAGDWFGLCGVGSNDARSPLRNRPAAGPDRLLCAMVLMLTALGMVMVFSAGAAFAAKKYGDWTYFLKREAIYAALGLLAFSIAQRTDYAAYRRWAYPLLLLTIALLGSLLLFGVPVKGAVRWFRVGPLSFQPSELAKFALCLYLSLLLSRNAEKVKAFSMGVLPPLVMSGLVIGLVVVEPDLGTAVILGVMTLAMLFVSGARMVYLALAVLVTAPVVWKVLVIDKAWRMKRMLAFLDPWNYCKTAGYQLCESLISVGSGGIAGQGLGQSRAKLFFLPEAHTDFILAIIAEELGLVGVLALLVGFGLLVWRGLMAALRARDVFGSFLAFGITSLFALQALANMGVVLGLLPTKGLALPFISYGGSSLIVSLFMAGVLANISARNPEPRPSPLFRSLRKRKGPGKNRKAERGPTIIVELGASPRRPLRPVVIADQPTAADLASEISNDDEVSEVSQSRDDNADNADSEVSELSEVSDLNDLRDDSDDSDGAHRSKRERK